MPLYGYWFVDLGQSQVWMPEQGLMHPLMRTQLPQQIADAPAYAFAAYQEKPCYWVDLSASALPQWARVHLRALLIQNKVAFSFASQALERAHFYRTHRYCGLCGQALSLSQEQWLASCSCGHIYYPQVHPCVIVAVTRGDTILLAQHQRHVQLNPPFYTVLAGFVEPAETLEQAVQREVREEVGLAVEDICYYASQPWPFPNHMMIGFTACYASGDLQVDPQELLSAAFYRYDQLPNIPPVGSIARELINESYRRIKSKF